MSAFVVHLAPLEARPAGVIARIAALLEADALERGAPGPLTLDDAIVACAAGLRTYQFSPDDNWAWRDEFPGELFRWESLHVDSYGVGESLALHLERDLRRYSVAKPVECFGLLRHELEAGRPLVAERSDGVSFLAVGLERGERGWQLEGASPTETLAYESLDATPERSLAFATVVRPASEGAPDSRRTMLWRDALRFPLRHAQSQKELVHHEELFYASGTRAWTATRERVLECRAVDGFADYWTAWCAAHAEGRRAHARAFRAWGRVPTQPALEGLAPVADAIDAAAAEIAALGALALDSPALPVAIDQAAAADDSALAALDAALPPTSL